MSLLLLFVPTTTGTTLAIQDGVHGHTADNLTLTQVHNLTVQDSTHSHTADNIILTQVHILAVQDSTHSHTSDNLTLMIPVTLVIQDATHGGGAVTTPLSNIILLPDGNIAFFVGGKNYIEI